MKRIKILILIITFMFMLPVVYAGTAYVDYMVIDAKVNENGSMTVTETIAWDIEGKLNGVYRDILLKNSDLHMNGASGIDVSKVTVDGKEYTYSTQYLSNGDSDQYNILNIDNGVQIRIYSPSEDESKLTVITYTLYDVVTKNTDVAEIYWNFIGDGWDYGMNSVTIRVSVPGNPKIFKVFGHGPLNGFSEIVSENQVVLKAENVRANEQIDARIVFDTELVESIKSFQSAALSRILGEEETLAKEANLKRERAKILFYISIIVVAIAVMIPIILYMQVRRATSKSTFKGKYYRELPEDYGPAIMTKLLQPMMTTATSEDMLATLLDLVRRKYVEIEPIYKNDNKKPYDYKLKLINTDLSSLNDQETHFVNELIFVGETEITLKELSKKNSKSVKARKKAYLSYTKWSDKITKLAEQKELLKKDTKNAGKGIGKCVICLLATIAILALGGITNYEDIMMIGAIGMFVNICELAIIGTKIYEMRIRTEKGVEHKEMWEAFKRFVTDFSKLDEHDYKSIAIWEHYLVYATALGVSKKVIKQLKIVFPTEFEDVNNMYNTYATIGLLSSDSSFSSFSNSFNIAASTAFSSPSSNGSGGGFSGGAGGRRRWRWWRRILATK